MATALGCLPLVRHAGCPKFGSLRVLRAFLTGTMATVRPQWLTDSSPGPLQEDRITTTCLAMITSSYSTSSSTPEKYQAP